MSDVIRNGRIPLSSLRSLIENCRFPAGARILMESQPQKIVTAWEERQELLLFRFFDPKIEFEKYTSGRIFQESGELRWEKEREQVRVVYVGNEDEILTIVESFLRDYPQDKFPVPVLPTMRAQQKKYFLFGTRLQKDDLKKIGSAAKEGDFAEARIHRVLRYALEGEKTQGPICFIVQELYDAATGQLVLFRFVGLDENNKEGEEVTAG